MSRICGIIDDSHQPDRLVSDLNQLLSPMRHSADFAVDSAISAPVALGRVFFSAHNFSTHLARLPLHNATCLFTGYLRDLPELSRRVREESHGDVSGANPAEVIAFLVLRHGQSILANLSGSFVYALWTANDGTLQIGTDRWGMATLYYRRSGRRFSFASEIKALLNLEPESDISLTAVEEIFTIGAPIGDHTLYPSIFRLPPASVLTLRDGKVTIDRYWWYDQVRSGGPTDLEEFIGEMRRLFSVSMEKLLVQIERPICMLSAGYDSRRILLEMAAQSRVPNAYTASIIQPTGGFEVDTSVTRTLCRELGVPHVHSELPSTSMHARLTRQTYQLLDFETDAHAWILPLLPKVPVASGVNFDGTGGDVLEDGNFTFAGQAEHIDDPAWLANSVVERFPNFWGSHFAVPVPEPPLVMRVADEIRKLPVFDHRFTIFYFMNWTRRKTSLFSQRLVSLRLDSVYPFLDYDLVDLLLSVPPLWKKAHKIRPAYLERVDGNLLNRLPSSHTTDIFTKPDPQWAQYCKAVEPGYLPEARVALYRAAGYDILRTGGVWGQLSRHARMAAMAFAMPGPSSVATDWLTRRAWPLRLAGMYALQRRSAADPGLARRMRAEAQAYVYASEPARPVTEVVSESR